MAANFHSTTLYSFAQLTLHFTTPLQSLLLDDNMISDLPVNMNYLVSLRSLSVAHNALSSLPMKVTSGVKICMKTRGNGY